MSKYTVNKYDYCVWGISAPCGRELIRLDIPDKTGAFDIVISKLDHMASELNKLQKENEQLRDKIKARDEALQPFAADWIAYNSDESSFMWWHRDHSRLSRSDFEHAYNLLKSDSTQDESVILITPVYPSEYIQMLVKTHEEKTYEASKTCWVCVTKKNNIRKVKDSEGYEYHICTDCIPDEKGE